MAEIFEVKALEEMPKALNYLIKKVDSLQETVNTLDTNSRPVNHLDG